LKGLEEVGIEKKKQYNRRGREKRRIQLANPKVWKAVWFRAVPPTWNQTYFFLLHRAWPVGEKAHAQQWDNFDPGYPNCPRPRSLETFYHSAWECPAAQEVWDEESGPGT